MSVNKSHLIVFDMDGTLVDSSAIIKAAMRIAFQKAGLEIPHDQQAMRVVGLSLPEAVRALVPGLSDDDVRAAAQLYHDAFVELRNDASFQTPNLFAGAIEAIGRLALRPDILLGIATGQARRSLDHTLDSLGLSEHFVTLQTADLHPSKPHPSMLDTALAETGTERQNAVMVGDTSFDIQMAQAAGVASIGVGWGYHPPLELTHAGAICVLDSFDEIDAALAQIWNDH